MPITYRKVSGSRNSSKPAILVSNIPPNRITGEPREIGAPALKVTYNPRVTPLNANPTPILAKTPESWACCGMPRAHCHSTQASPVENVQLPYINTAKLLESLPAAIFTQRSAAANAHAVTNAYLIQPIIQICPPVVNATNCYHRLIIVDPRINETLQTGAVGNRTYRVGESVYLFLESTINCGVPFHLFQRKHIRKRQ